MIFTLIKNEIIKIMKRPKTWIVFGLFFLCIVGIIIIDKKSADSMEDIYSPEVMLKNLNHEKDDLEDTIKNLKNSTDDKSKMEAISLEQNLKDVENRIEKQKKYSSEDIEDYWKFALNDEKEQLNKNLEKGGMDDAAINQMNKRIKQIDEAIEKNERPVNEWEFNAINYGKSIFKTIGFIILAIGICIFMSDIVSGEATPPTLKFLLVQPVSRGKILFSKFIAVNLIVITMICGLELVSFGSVGAFAGFGGAKQNVTISEEYKILKVEGSTEEHVVLVPDSGYEITRIDELVRCFGLQILYIIACVSFIFLISTLFKSSMISMAVSIIISVLSTMSCIMLPFLGKRFASLLFFNYGDPTRVLEGNIACSFTNVTFTVQRGIILMIITIVGSYVLSHIIFKRRDMLV